MNSRPSTADSEIAFHQAISQEVVWKNDEVRRFAVALVREVVEQFYAFGVSRFTTDIVPDEVRSAGCQVAGGKPGSGIAGSVVELLKNANVIEPVGVMVEGKWYPERMKSKRPGCKSRYLCVHRLKSRAVAEAFLRRNGAGAMCQVLGGKYEEQDLAIR